MLRAYYMLTKPGIIMGNIFTTMAGFALASGGHINFPLFFSVILGLAFVIASAGVFNNYIDREADKKMERTKERPLAKGILKHSYAILFGTILGLSGFLFLLFTTNVLTALIAFIGFFFYLILYSIWKYRSIYGTLVGSIAGAVPPVVGYTAASNRFDFAALLLFIILILWQMPHFYAIAVYRLKEYTAANIPVLPVKKGIYVTKIQSLLYIIAFMGVLSLLTLFGYTGNIFLMASLFLGLSWLLLSYRGFRAKNDERWGKQMFRLSLAVITVLCLVIPFDLGNQSSASSPRMAATSSSIISSPSATGGASS